jgi:hypothetical protein
MVGVALSSTRPSGLTEKPNEQRPEPSQSGQVSLLTVEWLFAFGAGALLHEAVQLAKDPVSCVLVLF